MGMKRMAKKFKVIVERGLDGYFIGEVPELQGCYSQGKTVKELMSNIKEAVELYLETMRELNKKPERKYVEIREVVANA